MNDKIIFREMLTEISELAETKNKILTVDEIKDFFKKVSLTDEHMELVYSYLEVNKIVVQGHKKNDEIKIFEENEELQELENNTDISERIEKFNAEENQYLKMYLEELGTLPLLDEEEKVTLYNQAIRGNSFAKSRVIEIYLQEVVEIARNYGDQGILISDLIQEGNIGLMLAVDEIDELASVLEVEKVLREGIIASIESVIEENNFIKNAKKQIVNKVNYLNEGVKNLEEELGRAANMEEVANYMEMSVEEVSDIIRVSDDEIRVRENEEKNNKQQ
ncbi:MAG: sigma-70 domain-containing protein [Lachnotalea sp.]